MSDHESQGKEAKPDKKDAAAAATPATATPATSTTSVELAQKRVFIAVNAAVESVRRAADAQMSMRSGAKARGLKVSWVPTASMHVTLRFLGSVPADFPGGLRDLLRKKLAGWKPFTFSLAGVGAFPSVEKPRVLWVGIQDPSGELARLAGAMEGWMRELGFTPEEREWKGHLTLGRVKEAAGGAAEVLAPHREKNFGATTVNEVVIYESRTLASGAEYTALARVALGAEPGLVWPESEPWQPGREPRVASEKTAEDVD